MDEHNSFILSIRVFAIQINITNGNEIREDIKLLFILPFPVNICFIESCPFL